MLKYIHDLPVNVTEGVTIIRRIFATYCLLMLNLHCFVFFRRMTVIIAVMALTT